MATSLHELIQTDCAVVGSGRISVASVVTVLLPLSLTKAVLNALTIDAAVFAVAAGVLLSAFLIAFDYITTQERNLKHLTGRSIRGKIPFREPVKPDCASSLRSILTRSPDGCICRDHGTSLP